MKKLLPLLFAFAFLGCEEKDLSVNNPNPPEENVSLSTSYLYEDMPLRKDTLYENNHGQQFYIDDVKLLISNFFLISGEDTIHPAEKKYFTYSFDKQGHLIMKIPKGGYTAKYGLTLGVDSADSFNVKPEETSEDSGLRDEDIIREDNFGYNAIVIKGRYLDPLKPLDTMGTDFEYQVGGYLLSRTLMSDKMNFAVTNTSEVRLFVVLNLGSILSDMDIKKRLRVLSNYSNPVDFAIAQDMLTNLQIDLF